MLDNEISDKATKHTQAHSSFLATKDHAVKYHLAQSCLQLCKTKISLF